MSENPQVSSGNRDAKPAQVHRGGLHYLKIGLTILVLVIALVFDLGELLKQINMKTLANPTMFSIPTEITTRFKACNYNFLFFCELKPAAKPCVDVRLSESEEAVCISVATAPENDGPPRLPSWISIPYLTTIIYAAELLPRLPDAIWHMLKLRWGMGHLEFSMGVVFTLAYITLIVVVLRSKSTIKFLLFVLAIVYGPYVILGIFWLLQHALLGAASGVSASAAFLIWLLGVPGCLLTCIGHESESIAKAVSVVGKGARV
jgi:hypothetical protein